MSAAQSTAQPRRSRNPLLALTKVFNPLVLGLAGTRLLPLYGVLQHRGRRSGKTFRTPLVVQPTGDGFIVPMPWGESTDWYRNVKAAGECTIRWNGRTFSLVQPEVVDPAQAGFSGWQAAAMRRLGIVRALRLRHRVA